MSYSDDELAVGCPKCNAAPTAKCLTPVKDGNNWMDSPHAERVEAARKYATFTEEYIAEWKEKIAGSYSRTGSERK